MGNEPTAPTEQTEPPNMSIHLPTALTEHQKAVMHLVAAAMEVAISGLRQGVNTFAAMAETNDLAFRRAEGKVAVPLGSEEANAKLFEAARNFVAIEQATLDEKATDTPTVPTDFLIFAHGRFLKKIRIRHRDDARLFIDGCNEGVLISEAYEGRGIATFVADDPRMCEHITDTEIAKALAAPSSQPSKFSELCVTGSSPFNT